MTNREKQDIFESIEENIRKIAIKYDPQKLRQLENDAHWTDYMTFAEDVAFLTIDQYDSITQAMLNLTDEKLAKIVEDTLVKWGGAIIVTNASEVCINMAKEIKNKIKRNKQVRKQMWIEHTSSMAKIEE